MEVNPGSCFTPGFPNFDKPTIHKDQRGIKRLEIPRKRISRTINPIATSSWLVLGWRANCDIQFIRFETDPRNPDPSEIGNVTDYVVSYACKGTEAFTDEKQSIRDLINKTQTITDDIQDIKTLSRRILNRSLGSKMISKQEAMVQLTNLRLFECSERIENLSLSSGARIDAKQSTTKGNKMLNLYEQRKTHKNYSLFDFFCLNLSGVSIHPKSQIQTPSTLS